MFDDDDDDGDSSSARSAEHPKAPFSAVEAAANAMSRRKKRPANPDLQRQIEHIFSQPAAPRAPARTHARTSRYVAKLVESARRRRADAQRALERRIVRQREAEQQRFGSAERFVTPAYRRRLAENDRLQQAEREEQREQPSAQNVSGFYTRLLHASMSKATGNESESDGDHGNRPGAGLAPAAGPASHGEHAPPAIAQRSQPQPKPAPPPAARDAQPGTSRATGSHQSPRDHPSKRENLIQKVAPRQKRGLRRNTAQSIEAYRQRYFERRAKRLDSRKT